jgi:hypothetical protein
VTDNEKLAGQLTELWQGKHALKAFSLDAPVKLTEYAAGRFHKKSYIGEEELYPIGAYVGKKGNVILKFKEVDADAAHSHIEMAPGEATSHLAGFSVYYMDVLATLEDLLVQETREVAAAKEETADTEARRSTDPLFGSWS